MELSHPGAAETSPLHLVSRPDPVPGDGEVLIEVQACAVCRTDLQIVEGDLEAHQLPLVPGHQVVGRVLAAGPGAAPLGQGELVGVGWLARTCGVCDMCRRGRENLCRRAEFTGWDRDGGYATHMVASREYCYPIPRGLSAVDAAPLLCGGIIGYRSFKLAEVGPGDRLGLYGFGASALLVAQVAIHQGCQVYVVTRGTAAQERARAAGATWVGAPGQPPPEPLQAAITFAPAGAVVVEALRALDRAGSLVINAIHLDRVPEFEYQHLYWERRVQSAANFTRQDSAELLHLASEIPIRTQHEEFPLEDANQTLLKLKTDGVRGAAVLIP